MIRTDVIGVVARPLDHHRAAHSARRASSAVETLRYSSRISSSLWWTGFCEADKLLLENQALTRGQTKHGYAARFCEIIECDRLGGVTALAIIIQDHDRPAHHLRPEELGCGDFRLDAIHVDA